jgi:hypothetical protein
MPAHGQLLVDRVDVAGQDSAAAVQLGQASRQLVDRIPAVHMQHDIYHRPLRGHGLPGGRPLVSGGLGRDIVDSEPRAVASRSTSRRMPRPSGYRTRNAEMAVADRGSRRAAIGKARTTTK